MSRRTSSCPDDVLGSGGDQPCVRFVGNVVVVAIETAAGDPVGGGEVVELVQVAVAHQMRPEPAVGGPERVVDQDRHEPILWSAFTPDAATRPLAFAGGASIR